MITQPLNPKSHVGYKILSAPPNRPEDQTQELHKGTCLFCGKTFLIAVKGRKRIWCSDSCKVKAMRYRKVGWPYPAQIWASNKAILEAQP